MSNYGIENSGSGNVTISGAVAMGTGTSVTQHGVAPVAGPAAPQDPARAAPAWDAGVVTVLSVETRAVLDELSKWGSHAEARTRQGAVFHEFTREHSGRTVRLVVTQSLLPGQHSAGGTVEELRREYAPRLVVLVGIAGSIHPDALLGDVVVAQEVIHYEPRKVTPDGVLRRGRAHAVTAGVQHAVNGFFTAHGEPWPLPHSPGHRALRGPIGSGEAVLADVRADERHYLREYNEKILAVETEGAGLATAVHASLGGTDAAHAWLVVRGISDAADADKNDGHHELAARNAAFVFSSLLPHLAG
ncbi:MULTISPECIES: 5'-methylthioadenosine/S-adenosylhomocysteine nucleosidase [Streptomyces]|uniref:Nucleoside phosphorylase domain-containing protein n=1 Tax=Streptomyces venezuelae TaxID=54571 RepID=A0A5P2BI87_STRVZ|nr:MULTISPECIES: 5'-methylthioadenosine/S-adenosylhomocysteine nucleosidase [Streptomyces]NEA01118.1 5'-methylthioadenosine/S-adenosylhomocysteine nucleosidase [Streptomyces sp. SID10116]MYY82221.1 hypothetical protein [Streptomyces sp. SID335]NDZ84182.1 5'-methylthioadenosine/S-adenosylhomocysteine nucleosidase [Streptomyces sp. SID10115]NEB49771.1 5'-methylthioadenosine/S-adenosylhomocysteine nucleosidase [Streptomyces sp. SID339]QES30183.1 hypothetical protein DEJ47_30450 [Streptomyces vene